MNLIFASAWIARDLYWAERTPSEKVPDPCTTAIQKLWPLIWLVASSQLHRALSAVNSIASSLVYNQLNCIEPLSSILLDRTLPRSHLCILNEPYPKHSDLRRIPICIHYGSLVGTNQKGRSNYRNPDMVHYTNNPGSTSWSPIEAPNNSSCTSYYNRLTGSKES